MKPIFPGEQLIPFTKDGYEQLLKEKDQLLKERPDAVENLRKAREMGDLRENGYYKASRARLSFLDGRIKRVDRLIRLATIVTATNITTVQIGSTVTLDEHGTTMVYTIVGGYESNPDLQTISHMSPLGKALIGKRVGDTVQVVAPKGKREFKITRIEI